MTPAVQSEIDGKIGFRCVKSNGVPATGTYQEPPGQLPVITQGNENLKPEKSRNLTFGAVFSPRFGANNGFISAFSVEADYHDIKVKNALAKKILRGLLKG